MGILLERPSFLISNENDGNIDIFAYLKNA